VQTYIKKLAIATALLASALPSTSLAADRDPSLSFLRDVAINSSKLLSPSVFGIPSARTMGWRNGFLAGAVASDSRSNAGGDNAQFDASAAVGLGMGNPQKNAGFDTYVGIISVNPKASNGSSWGFGEDGNLSFKLGKTFLTNSFDSISFAIGANNLVAWGVAEKIQKNYYGVATLGSACTIGEHIFPVSISVGGGTKQDSNRSSGAFAGVGVGLSSVIDLSAGYNANRWVSGLNFSFARFNDSILRHLIVQVGVDDLFDHNHNRRGVFIAAIPFTL
jgi:hypothetical protein